MQVLEQLAQGASVAVISDAGDTLARHVVAQHWLLLGSCIVHSEAYRWHMWVTVLCRHAADQ